MGWIHKAEKVYDVEAVFVLGWLGNEINSFRVSRHNHYIYLNSSVTSRDIFLHYSILNRMLFVVPHSHIVIQFFFFHSKTWVLTDTLAQTYTTWFRSFIYFLRHDIQLPWVGLRGMNVGSSFSSVLLIFIIYIAIGMLCFWRRHKENYISLGPPLIFINLFPVSR